MKFCTVMAAWVLAGFGTVGAQELRLDGGFEAVKVAASVERGEGSVEVVKEAGIKDFNEPTFARVKGAEFGAGTIEVAVLARLVQGLSGSRFGSAPEWKFDRLRKEAAGVYETYADMGLDEWITMRIEVKGKQARLYLNVTQQPALVVNDLKLGADARGGVGLWVDVGTEGYFRVLKIPAAR